MLQVLLVPKATGIDALVWALPVAASCARSPGSSSCSVAGGARQR